MVSVRWAHATRPLRKMWLAIIVAALHIQIQDATHGGHETTTHGHHEETTTHGHHEETTTHEHHEHTTTHEHHEHTTTHEPEHTTTHEHHEDTTTHEHHEHTTTHEHHEHTTTHEHHEHTTTHEPEHTTTHEHHEHTTTHEHQEHTTTHEHHEHTTTHEHHEHTTTHEPEHTTTHEHHEQTTTHEPEHTTTHEHHEHTTTHEHHEQTTTHEPEHTTTHEPEHTTTHEHHEHTTTHEHATEGDWLSMEKIVWAAKNLINESEAAANEVLVPAGAVGRIVQTDPLAVEWTTPVQLVARVPQDFLVGQACVETCEGVAAYLESTGVSRTLPSLAETCLAVQADGAETAACFVALVHDVPECAAAQAMTNELAEECLDINPGHPGISIHEPVGEVSYASKSCVLCSYLEGAEATYGANSARLDTGTREECEESCDALSYSECSAFDYDATRGACRLWERCPERSQRSDNTCFWTLYERPCSGEDCPVVGTTLDPEEPSETTGSENETVFTTLGVVPLASGARWYLPQTGLLALLAALSLSAV